MNNNSDNDTVNTNEILFWKVFHNKFLLFTIFQKIEIIGENSVGEKMKFKDIKSLDCMIKNKQYSILKCKLEAGEDIEITQESLFSILKFYGAFLERELNRVFKPTKNQYFTETEYKLGDEFIDDSNELKIRYKEETEIGKLNLKQSFQLLLKHKPKQVSTFKLIDYILSNPYLVEYSNELIDLLVCEPDSFIPTIYSSTIKEAIQYSTPLVLQKLLNIMDKDNINDIINKEVKNSSVSVSFKNKWHKESMLQFILNSNNSILYNIPNSNTNKRSKSNSAEMIQVQSNDSAIKIEIVELFSIESKELVFKLLDLGYLHADGPWIETENFEAPILKLLDNDCDEMTNEERYKELFLLISKRVDSVYLEYLIKYDQPVNGYNDHFVLDYSLNSKSINGLKYLLSKSQKSLEILKPPPKLRSKSERRQEELQKPFTIGSSSLEFIELYTREYKYFGNYNFDKQLLKFIIGIKSSQEYEIVLKSIIETNDNKRLIESIPTTWSALSISPYLESIKDGDCSIVIQDTDTIDLMYKDYMYLQLALNEQVLLFKFETIQLLEYAKSKYGNRFFDPDQDDYDGEDENSDGGEKEIKPVYYKYPFTRAINKFDIESLKEIDGKGFKIYNFKGCKVINQLKYSKQVLKKIKEVKSIKGYSDKVKIDFDINPTITTSQINQLLNYFNSTGYKSFTKDLFKKFITDLSKLPNSIDISSLKISFNQFPKSAIELILESITDNINSNLVQLVLINFNPFSTIELIDKSVKEWTSYSSELYDTSHYFYNDYQHLINPTQSCLYYKENFKNVLPKVCKSYESFQGILSIIKSLLNNLQHTISTATQLPIPNLTKLLLFNQELINYLYRRLIKVYNADIDNVLNIYQFIKSTWVTITSGKEFQFHHTLYHIFYYLDIKSKHFTNYILSLKSSTTVFGQRKQKTLQFDNMNFQFENSDYYNTTSTTPTTQNDQFKLLLPDIFSFDFILNSKIHQVYDKLKNTLKN